MAKIKFSITGFGFAKHSLNSEQRQAIQNIAQPLLSGDDKVPALSKVKMVEIIGHAIGTSNLKMHANRRADFVLEELNKRLEALGASHAEVK